MLRRFHDWLRVVLVPLPVFWLALVCVLAVWLLQQGFIQWLAIFAPQLNDDEKLMISRPGHFLAVLAFAALYGLHRAATFHPVTNRSYGTWLAQTPWRYPQPLPLGPLELVWQDIVVVAVLLSTALLPPHLDRSLLHLPIILFVAVYCADLAYWHLWLRVHWAWIAFVLLALIGLHVLANPLASVAIALAMYLVTRLGIAVTLQDFPYSEERRAELGLVPFEQQSLPEVPWPIAPLRDGHRWFTIKLRHAAIAGILVAIVFCSISFFFRHEPGFTRGLLLVHAIISTIAVAARLNVYIGGRWPPISLLGRIATRRLIIPGYDVALVAPLVMVLVAVLLPQTMLWMGIGPVLAVPMSTGATVSLALSLPPNLEKWHYTGHYRIPAVRRIGRDFVEV